jgi:hypothetical protein
MTKNYSHIIPLLLIVLLTGCVNSELNVGNFTNVDPTFLKQDNLADLNINKDFVLVTSLLSTDKTKLIYSVIDECATDLEVSCSDQFNVEYKIYLLNLASKQSKLLFELPTSTAFNKLIPTAYAGGCPSFPVPTTWSIDNKTVSLTYLNLNNNCGSGGGVYQSSNPFIDIETGEIKS